MYLLTKLKTVENIYMAYLSTMSMYHVKQNITQGQLFINNVNIDIKTTYIL